jgi:hypothetical protein
MEFFFRKLNLNLKFFSKFGRNTNALVGSFRIFERGIKQCLIRKNYKINPFRFFLTKIFYKKISFEQKKVFLHLLLIVDLDITRKFKINEEIK